MALRHKLFLSGSRQVRRLLLPALAAGLLVRCGSPGTPAETTFDRLSPRHTGITFENRLEQEPLFNILNYLYFFDGGGVAVGDVNNDGLADIYFTANMGTNRLYINQGDFRFTDVTESAGVGGDTQGWPTGVTMADVNGDGFLDIYVCRSNYLDRSGANQLYINNGDLTFTERAAEYGLDQRGLSRQAAFFDYDLDGDLDMYLLSHSLHAKQTYGDTSLRAILDAEAGDKLFENQAGRFRDVTAQAGIHESILGYGLGVAVGDINGDGYPDLYISNDFHENDYLYYNRGDGTFAEALGASMGHTSSASMGNDMADINNDGLLDVVVADMLPEDEAIRKSSVTADPYDVSLVKLRFGYQPQYRRNTLQLNRGPAPGGDEDSGPARHLFSEIGLLAGVHATDWSWATLLVDLDNDGFKDLFITNGIYRRPNDLDFLEFIRQNEPRLRLNIRYGQQSPPPMDMKLLAEIVAQMPSVPQANYAYHANGDLTFTNRAAAWGLARPGFSSGAAYADFDNDGAMDLVVNNTNAPADIYRNRLYDDRPDPLRPANYLKVILAGAGLNTFGLGSRVSLYAGERQFFQELAPTRGFQSSVEPVLNFGLGSVGRLDSLVVLWPTGERQVLLDLPVNQTVTLRQTEALSQATASLPDAGQPWLEDITGRIGLPFRHRENRFIEFNREPFIPHFISTLGPAAAVADVNGDGLDDLFLGGAKHQPGALYLQDRSGGFTASSDSVFIRDGQNEDVDALFFDANGDGRPDLYVVSGGNEFFGQAPALKDRLYLNQGDGRFRRAEAHLPQIFANGSVVAAADFDLDGDIDLFVGSRSISRRYGSSPDSYLLVNDGQGRFSDGSATLAPGLAGLGMVTDALWADLNGDTFPDLVVVGEWMPVTVFHNLDGRLVNVTAEYGLDKDRGWWTTVAAGDLNGDGLVDLVAGNLGRNSLLKASAERPIKLFIHDFSGNGRPDQILAYAAQGDYYPLASYELLTTAIPALKQKYPASADYGGQSIARIFPAGELAAATVLTATHFASTLLLNRGDGTFGVEPLPEEAQFSPVYAVLLGDFNRDGQRDILLGGNFFGVAPDRGRYDASYGTLLLGDGSGSFQPATLQQSGFAVTGEIRHMLRLGAAGGDSLIIVARNNAGVKIYR